MKFAVIYSVDYPRFTYLGRERVKPLPKGKWVCTENNTSEYDIWDECGQHYKYCAILTKEEFIEFVEGAGLIADPVETMGSLGFPTMGISPAISFRQDDYIDVIRDAYVTPLPEPIIKKEKSFTERDWYRLKKVILRMFK